MSFRKIGLAIITIIIAMLFIGGSVYAWYDDSIVNDGNRFRSSTLYLIAGDSELIASQFGNIFPGWGTDACASTKEEAQQVFTVTNMGTIAGRLCILFDNLKDIQSSDLPEGLGDGRLSEHIYITVSYKILSTDHAKVVCELDNITLQEACSIGKIEIHDLAPCVEGALESAEYTAEVCISYHINNESGSEIQGTSLNFDTLVSIDQIVK